MSIWRQLLIPREHVCLSFFSPFQGSALTQRPLAFLRKWRHPSMERAQDDPRNTQDAWPSIPAMWDCQWKREDKKMPPAQIGQH